jgi:hypothetical protein
MNQDETRLVLAQEQEVRAQLILGQRGGIALEMLGEFTDVANVLLFGRSAEIFKLDVLFELSVRRIVDNHRLGRMPVSADNFPAKPPRLMRTGCRTPRRAAAQCNEPRQPTPVGRHGFIWASAARRGCAGR